MGFEAPALILALLFPCPLAIVVNEEFGTIGAGFLSAGLYGCMGW